MTSKHSRSFRVSVTVFQSMPLAFISAITARARLVISVRHTNGMNISACSSATGKVVESCDGNSGLSGCVLANKISIVFVHWSERKLL